MKIRKTVVSSLLLLVLAPALLGGCCSWCRQSCRKTACGPDLVVTAASFDAAARTVSVTVRNRGTEPAGDFLVYVEINQTGAPDTAKPESQHSASVAGLDPCEETTLADIPLTAFSERPSIDLATLQHGVLVVTVNAKGMVRECDATNNMWEREF